MRQIQIDAKVCGRGGRLDLAIESIQSIHLHRGTGVDADNGGDVRMPSIVSLVRLLCEAQVPVDMNMSVGFLRRGVHSLDIMHELRGIIHELCGGSRGLTLTLNVHTIEGVRRTRSILDNVIETGERLVHGIYLGAL